MNAYTRQRIENWASDFCASDAIREVPQGLRDMAPAILTTFLAGACKARDVEPEEVEEADLKAAMLGPVARLGIPEDSAPGVPSLCGVFLEFLEAEGRLGGGRVMGAFVRALGASLAPGGKPRPVVRPGSKLGPNAPCPCGSGRKFKKCCKQ
jgi:hypothetical protein